MSTPDIEATLERIEIDLNQWMSASADDIRALAAAYRDLEAENERLLREVREWLCAECNTVYPGPPQDGVRCVICPSCGGGCAPRSSDAQVLLQQRRAEKAEARVKRLEEAVRSCSYEPPLLLGQHHCPECGEMVVGGYPHMLGDVYEERVRATLRASTTEED